MILWFWFCYEVQHWRVQDIPLKCFDVTGAEMRKCPDHGAALQEILLYPAPCPSALSGEAQLALGSCGTAAWHGSSILKAVWGKVVEPGKHSLSKETGTFATPRVAKSPSKAGLWSQQHLLLMAVVQPAQGHQTQSIAYMEVTAVLGDESKYPGFCGIKWGYMA